MSGHLFGARLVALWVVSWSLCCLVKVFEYRGVNAEKSVRPDYM